MTIEKPVRIPKPAGPTPQEASDLNRGRRKSRLSRLAGSKLADLTLAVTAAAGALQLAHTVDSRVPSVPGIMQRIEGLFEPPAIEDKHPDVFDVNETPRLTYKNTVGIVKTGFSPDIQHRTVALPIPFEIKDDTSIDFRRVKSGDSGGIESAIVFSNIPKGTVIRAPISGKYFYDKTTDLLGKSHTLVSIRFLETPDRFRNLIFSLGESTTLIPSIKRVSEQGVIEYKTETDVEAGQPLFTVDDGELGINISPGAGDENSDGAAYENGTPVVSYYELSIQTQGDKAIFIK